MKCFHCKRKPEKIQKWRYQAGPGEGIPEAPASWVSLVSKQTVGQEAGASKSAFPSGAWERGKSLLGKRYSLLYNQTLY